MASWSDGLESRESFPGALRYSIKRYWSCPGEKSSAAIDGIKA